MSSVVSSGPLTATNFQFSVQGPLLSVPPTEVCAQVLRFGDKQSQIWLGGNQGEFNHLAFAIQDRKDEKKVDSAKVYGELISETNPTDDLSSNLASKLSRKLKKPIFVSYNCEEDPKSVAEIQKELFKLIKEKPEAF